MQCCALERRARSKGVFYFAAAIAKHTISAACNSARRKIRYIYGLLPPAPKSGRLGRTRSEGPHSLDEGVHLRIGADSEPAPVLVRWETAPHKDIPTLH